MDEVRLDLAQLMEGGRPIHLVKNGVDYWLMPIRVIDRADGRSVDFVPMARRTALWCFHGEN